MPKNHGVPGLAVPAERVGYAKSLDTRARILAAALEEASDSGIHKASLAAIAARAGVAIGSLNYHFGSREELLRELMGTLTTDLLSRLHVAEPDEDADFFERERAGLLVYLEYVRANPTYLRLAGEIKLHEPDLYRRAVGGWVERIAARIRLGIARGTLRPMDDAELAAQAYFMLGASQFLDHMMEKANGHPYPGEAAVVDAYVSLLRGGLGLKPRSRSATIRRTSPSQSRKEKRRWRPRSKSRAK